MDHAKRCTNRKSQFGIYSAYALPHMIIGQPELMTLAHVLDWLLAMTIFTFGLSITYSWPIHNIQDISQPLSNSWPIPY